MPTRFNHRKPLNKKRTMRYYMDFTYYACAYHSSYVRQYSWLYHNGMINRPPVNLHISINHLGLIRIFIAVPSSRNDILVGSNLMVKRTILTVVLHIVQELLHIWVCNCRTLYQFYIHYKTFKERLSACISHKFWTLCNKINNVMNKVIK